MHWIEFMPDHVYCFIPSFEIDKGEAFVYDHMPDLVKQFLYCQEIKTVVHDQPSRTHLNQKWNRKTQKIVSPDLFINFGKYHQNFESGKVETKPPLTGRKGEKIKKLKVEKDQHPNKISNQNQKKKFQMRLKPEPEKDSCFNQFSVLYIEDIDYGKSKE